MTNQYLTIIDAPVDTLDYSELFTELVDPIDQPVIHRIHTIGSDSWVRTDLTVAIASLAIIQAELTTAMLEIYQVLTDAVESSRRRMQAVRVVTAQPWRERAQSGQGMAHVLMFEMLQEYGDLLEDLGL